MAWSLSVKRLRPILLAVALLGRANALAAQTEFYDLDAGHPLRIDDAIAMERRALDLSLANFRFERFSAGRWRGRNESRIAVGIAPFTEIEVRAPLVALSSPGNLTLSLAGIGVGALRQLAVESEHFPAIAVGGAVDLPVGGLSSPGVHWAGRAMMTRTFSQFRMHTKAEFGTFGVRSSILVACAAGSAGCVAVDTTSNPPIPPDGPCFCSAMRAQQQPFRSDAVTVKGRHWLAGSSIDHTFVFQSVLVAADLYVEKFTNLYPKLDWTTGAGMRWQASPRVVLHASASDHFAGVSRSISATAGMDIILGTSR